MAMVDVAKYLVVNEVSLVLYKGTPNQTVQDLAEYLE